MNPIAMWTIVATTTLFLWLLGFSSAQPPLDHTQNPMEGSRVFGNKGCSKCHAINGVGGRTGPDLARVGTAKSFYGLAASMWNHLPDMAREMDNLDISRPLFSPRETEHLIAFLFIFNYFDPAGDLQVGRRLFSDKKCVICHQVGGVGGAVGPSLDALGQYGAPIHVAAAMWNHGPTMAAAMRAKGIERPTLTRAELLDLIGYLRSVSPEVREETLEILPGSKESGQKLFRDKGCMKCHSIKGQGGRVGPDLLALEMRGGVIGLAVAMWNKAPKMMEAMEARKITVPQIKAGEMADIVAYLYDLRYFAQSGNSNNGRKLLNTKGCLNCHSIGGQGGKTASDLRLVKGLDSLATVMTALWNHISIPSFMERQRSVWPRFSSQEMADLVAFLQGPGSGQR